MITSLFVLFMSIVGAATGVILAITGALPPKQPFITGVGWLCVIISIIGAYYAGQSVH